MSEPRISARNTENVIIGFGFTQMAKNTLAKGRSPPQELEVGLHSGLYLLVEPKAQTQNRYRILKYFF